MKIAIQGVRASFHDIVAHEYFPGKIEILECSTFKSLCENLKSQKCDFAVMAIENTIAGSILPNYSLLESYRFHIVGEHYLRISLALMGLKNLTDLEFVQSHPMALYQCEEFLNKHPKLKIIEGADTAESAKWISENKMDKYGAIAHEKAGAIYGLNILAKEIESNKQNFTRFLILSREPFSGETNKASLRFHLPHKPGALVQVLQVFDQFQINMTKLQSVPILGRPYEYGFHVDLEWKTRNDYEQALNIIKSKVTDLVLFGEYKSVQKPGAL